MTDQNIDFDLDLQAPIDFDDDTDDFDPLSPIEFPDDEENEEEVDYYVEKVPPIAKSIEEAAAERRAKYPVPVLTTPEKIAKTIKGMPGQKKLLLHVVDFCREERTDAQLVEEIVAFNHGTVNTYAPESIVAMLERCGALIQTNKPVEGEEAEQAANETADVEATQDADATEPAEEAASTEEEATEEIVEGEGEIEEVVVDEEETYLEVNVPEPARFIASPEGLEAAAQEDPAARFTAFMGEHPMYAEIFRIVLENCDVDCAEGLTQKQVGALIDDNPICKEPRRWAGYFIDKLEDADAIIYDKGWHTTDKGRAMLEEDGIIGAL